MQITWAYTAGSAYTSPSSTTKIQLHLLAYAQQRCGHGHTPEPGPCTNHSAPAHFIAFIAFIAFAFTLTTFMAFIAFIAFADTLTVFMAFIAFIAFADTLMVFMAFIAFIAFADTPTVFMAFIARRMPFFIGSASSTAFFIAFAMTKGEKDIEGYGQRT